jgi:hypothetical protein
MKQARITRRESTEIIVEIGLDARDMRNLDQGGAVLL